MLPNGLNTLPIKTNWKRMALYFDSWNLHNCWGLADMKMRNVEQMNKFL